jgi:hypothetical protein
MDGLFQFGEMVVRTIELEVHYNFAFGKLVEQLQGIGRSTKKGD